MSNARHGNPRQAYRTGLALAEWVCRTVIGSIRRECADHFIVLGEAYLRHILRPYARYYNHIRTHWSLSKDTPVYRPVQRIGSINYTRSWADFTITTYVRV